MAPRLILLDVEGTTTPISFVYNRLFPYARTRMRTWLRKHHLDPEVHDALLQLEKENIADVSGGAPLLSLIDDPQESADSAAAYCLWLMDRDRKMTPLKTIQGLIWQEGFKRGELQSEIFVDVPTSFFEWHRKGCRVAIYSSGSVTAQQLIFEHTPYGSLLPFIDAFFDTRVGPKQDAKSYCNIMRLLEIEVRDGLFISDIPAELDAASHAGLAAALAVRPGNPSLQPNSHDYPIIHSFSDLQL